MKNPLSESSFTGNLLVASSLVTEPIYAGGVCLIVHQDSEHVIGVMLNRPMKPSAEMLMAMLGGKSAAQPPADNRLGTPESTEAPQSEFQGDVGAGGLGLVHFGGPLSGPVVAIHQNSQFAEAETGSGIYMAAQKQHLEDLVRRKPGPYRLIIGHLGWEIEQLQGEVEAGIWHLVPATVESVFASAGQMWPGLIRRATSRSMARWMGTADVIEAAELN